MKGLLLFLLLLSSSLTAQEPFDRPEYATFLYKIDTFNRKLLGCPLKPDYITKEDCHPKQGTFDLKLWKEINDLASKIFILGKKSGRSSSHQAN